jgi:Mg-chelatase subunit ChlD
MSEQNQELLEEMFSKFEDVTMEGTDEIIVIVDRSGSMGSIALEAQGGINGFIDQQQKMPGEAKFTLVEFDSYVDIVQERVPLREATPYELQPRGMTSLYDAIGITLSPYVKGVETDDKGSKVVVIVTDGGENSSKEYTRTDINEMITSLQDSGWDFIFLAANQDAMEAGTSIGVKGADTVNFAATSGGVTAAYDTAMAYTSSVRMKSKADFYNIKDDLEKVAMDQFVDVANPTPSDSSDNS